MSGPITSVSIFGQDFVIVNSFEAAIDMMEKRGTTYSDRPQIPMAELSGWGAALAITPYSEDRLRIGRKACHKGIGTPLAMSQFYPVQEQEVQRLLSRLLVTPEKLREHLRL